MNNVYIEFCSNPIKTTEVIIQKPTLYSNKSSELTRWRDAGGRLNKKDGLTRYGDSHVKDKTS